MESEEEIKKAVMSAFKFEPDGMYCAQFEFAGEIEQSSSLPDTKRSSVILDGLRYFQFPFETIRMAQQEMEAFLAAKGVDLRQPLVSTVNDDSEGSDDSDDCNVRALVPLKKKRVNTYSHTDTSGE